MSNLIRWQPMRGAVTLRHAMDRLFDEAFTRPPAQTEAWRDVGGPFIDMYETENDLVIKASLPGLKSDDVQISVTGEMPTSRARQKRRAKSRTRPIISASSATGSSSAPSPCPAWWCPTKRTRSSMPAY